MVDGYSLLLANYWRYNIRCKTLTKSDRAWGFAQRTIKISIPTFPPFCWQLGTPQSGPSRHLKVTKFLFYSSLIETSSWMNYRACALRVFPHSRALIDARFLMINPYVAWVIVAYLSYFISIRRTGRLNALNVISRYPFTKRRIIPKFCDITSISVISIIPSSLKFAMRALWYSLPFARLLRVLWNLGFLVYLRGTGEQS